MLYIRFFLEDIDDYCYLCEFKKLVLEPAVRGTMNVMNVAVEVKVPRVVFTSTMAVTYMDPNRNPDKVVDETCWSDFNYVRNIQDWYCYGKILAENTAWEVARKRRVDLVTVIPPLTIGPLLQPNVNASIVHILKFLNGRNKTYGNAVQGYVHVKDLALAHILVYENHRRRAGTFASKACVTDMRLCSDEVNPRVKPYKFSNKRLKDLGLTLTPVKQALYDTVISLQQNGHLIVFPQSNTSPNVSDCQSWPSKPALAIGSSRISPRL
ncbi:hypothetical protein NE237_023752 [Protea cynaroides]|uniref:NAD-dependent epimerase/dehydratase domain-containing protein n=1 Tax=Protea cynaroides TaxID=273540 RepID=A0A9Q0K6S4_9MAGN|nr:hypothetical protein NE237_023752 [Protea cynaroides]